MTLAKLKNKRDKIADQWRVERDKFYTLFDKQTAHLYRCANDWGYYSGIIATLEKLNLKEVSNVE
jgi:hypothetical protein